MPPVQSGSLEELCSTLVRSDEHFSHCIGDGVAQWTQLPKYVYSIVTDTPDSVLLHTSRFDTSNKTSYLFQNPLKIVTSTKLDDLPHVFAQIEEALAQNLYVAGFLSYECGYHFEHFDGVATIPKNVPLAWFGIYRKPYIFDHARGRFEGDAPAQQSNLTTETIPTSLTNSISMAITLEDYRSKVLKIQELIAAGDTYQVNLTDKALLDIPLSPGVAFELLSQHQPVSYGAFIHAQDQYVLSLSPELFFKTEGRRIVTRPMKGTMPRGLDTDEDVLASLRLQRDEKNRSEHVMIVDLIRNDLGRICTMGSVTVEDIFSIERYETLLQMTSTILGELQPGLLYYDIFKRMFPSGSITGAPKIRTMQIIKELEDKPRGVYTGAIGFIAPNASSVFSVAIRTLILKDGRAEMGVGGAIVADSTASAEYDECLLKTAFLNRKRYDFQLFETLLWDKDFYLLPMHLYRIESSASYFNFSCDLGAAVIKLEQAAKLFQPDDCYRVKLTIDAAGGVSISSSLLPVSHPFERVRMSSRQTDSRDVFLRHKTTQRELYEQQYAEALADGFNEVIFTNERSEVTEGAISNIFARLGGKLLTPPLASGVLPGVYRRHLLETLDNAEEQTLTVEDLGAADAVFLCNSVRGIHQIRYLEGLYTSNKVI